MAWNILIRPTHSNQWKREICGNICPVSPAKQANSKLCRFFWKRLVGCKFGSKLHKPRIISTKKGKKKKKFWEYTCCLFIYFLSLFWWEKEEEACNTLNKDLGTDALLSLYGLWHRSPVITIRTWVQIPCYYDMDFCAHPLILWYRQ